MFLTRHVAGHVGCPRPNSGEPAIEAVKYDGGTIGSQVLKGISSIGSIRKWMGDESARRSL